MFYSMAYETTPRDSSLSSRCSVPADPRQTRSRRHVVGVVQLLDATRATLAVRPGPWRRTAAAALPYDIARSAPFGARGASSGEVRATRECAGSDREISKLAIRPIGHTCKPQCPGSRLKRLNE